MDEQMTAHVDNSIADLMKATGMTKTDIADDLGITLQSLRNKRRGETEWKWSEIMKLSDMAGKTPDELTGYQQT